MTQLISYLFDPNQNMILKLFTDGFNAIGVSFGFADDDLYYKLGLIAYVAFTVLCVWLSVKVISWLGHLLGIGGK